MSSFIECGTMHFLKPNRSASINLASNCMTDLTSPVSPTSPIITVCGSTDRFLKLPAIAAATPRSTAGSDILSPPAIFINTSRGKLVDEDGLYDVLSAGKISHACLDVYNNEPYTGKLNELDNVTLTCHIGSYAKEARIKMEEQAVENLLKGLG